MAVTSANCVFCAIVAGDEPAEIVYDDGDVVAFLDRTPLFAGHILVVPRAHIETLPDLPVERLADFYGVVQRVAAIMPATLGASGTFVANNNVVSQSVPHLHVHVVPRTKGDGLRGFFWPRRKYRVDEAGEVAERLRAALRKQLDGA